MKCSYHRIFLHKENGKLPYFKINKGHEQKQKIKIPLGYWKMMALLKKVT